MKTYKDARGWQYKVMGGIGSEQFKARYKKPDKDGWKGCSKLPWRPTEEEAQADLDELAKEKGWAAVKAVALHQITEADVLKLEEAAKRIDEMVKEVGVIVGQMDAIRLKNGDLIDVNTVQLELLTTEQSNRFYSAKQTIEFFYNHIGE